jgi:hypothetical protein
MQVTKIKVPCLGIDSKIVQIEFGMSYTSRCVIGEAIGRVNCICVNSVDHSNFGILEHHSMYSIIIIIVTAMMIISMNYDMNAI